VNGKESTEQKILKAAMVIFVQKGRHGAKMQEIADAAGINKAMLHYYFRNKEKLYAKVFHNVFAKIFGSLHKIFETDESFENKLTNFIDQYTRLIAENQQIPLFIMREISEGAEELKPIFNEILEEKKFALPITFIETINNSIQKGEIRKIDSRQIFITIIGSVVFYFIAEPILSVLLKVDPDFQRENFIEERKIIVVDIILNGIKP